MRKIKCRPVKDWHEETDDKESITPITQAKINGIAIVGDWKAVNNFMADYQQYLSILGQKYGVKVRFE